MNESLAVLVAELTNDYTNLKIQVDAMQDLLIQLNDMVVKQQVDIDHLVGNVTKGGKNASKV